MEQGDQLRAVRAKIEAFEREMARSQKHAARAQRQRLKARASGDEHAGKQPNLAAFSESQLRSCRAALDDVLYSRARHVVTEMGRIAAGVEALRAHDYALLGAQLNASHRSTSTDDDVSCEELDVITDVARSCEGVFGARLTGAGFGGCAIALIRPGFREQVTAQVGAAFVERFGVEPGFDLLRIGDGPGEIRS